MAATPEERLLNRVKDNPSYLETLFATRARVAARLDVHINTVDALIRTKELPVVRVGRKVLIPVRALENFHKRHNHSTEVPEAEAVAS